MYLTCNKSVAKYTFGTWVSYPQPRAGARDSASPLVDEQDNEECGCFAHRLRPLFDMPSQVTGHWQCLIFGDRGTIENTQAIGSARIARIGVLRIVKSRFDRIGSQLNLLSQCSIRPGATRLRK